MTGFPVHPRLMIRPSDSPSFFQPRSEIQPPNALRHAFGATPPSGGRLGLRRFAPVGFAGMDVGRPLRVPCAFSPFMMRSVKLETPQSREARRKVKAISHGEREGSQKQKSSVTQKASSALGIPNDF
jgi:hypothetical protein